MLRLVLLCLAFILPSLATAQGAATLVADSVTLSSENRLVADGNVEAFYDGTVLSASRITYDRTADRLSIEGPIFIRTADGQILTATRAELDPRLESGLLRSARLVLDDQLQLAANQITRVDGRYSALTRAAATSCQVCGTQAPLWEIRAENVIHDTETRQLYFDNASLLIRGVPVLWVPRMRLPDPTLERATGLLVPQVRTTNQLGIGLKLPYFIRIGDRRDLTLTPYLSSSTTTLEARYRQAYLRGDIEILASVGQDDIVPDTTRGFARASGDFDIGRGVELSFNVEALSDPTYLLDYGYSDQDRLVSGLTLTRVRPNDLFFGQAAFYTSLREAEVDSTLPPIVLDFGYERRISLADLGATVTWSVSADALQRTRTSDPASARDVARIGTGLELVHQWVSPVGLVMQTNAKLVLDYYLINDDPSFETGLRAGTSGSVTLRWPLMRPDPAGIVNIIEPIVSLGWSEAFGVVPPNEDGLLAELDEGNLMALTRTPGQDARELGYRASAGVAWTLGVPDIGTTTLTFGRVFQSQVQPAYSAASGQARANSDWLLSTQLTLDGGFEWQVRTLIDDDLDINKAETMVNWSNKRVDFNASYLWLPEDAFRDRASPASEWSFDTDWRISENWSLRAEARYDDTANQLARAGFGLGWQNECVTVDLSVARRYTSFTTEDPTTTFDLAINLTGFSAGRSQAGQASSCRT